MLISQQSIAQQDELLVTEEDKVNFLTHQIFVHGIPYKMASTLEPTAIPILVNILEDRRERGSWTNVVVTLGMIGNDHATAQLIEFLERKEETKVLSREEYAAKSVVPIALGYIVNKSQSERALNYLVDGASLDGWDRRNLDWESPYTPQKEERNRQLLYTSILGLGVSGHSTAANLLRILQRSSDEDTKNVATSALEANQIISNSGLSNYYDK